MAQKSTVSHTAYIEDGFRMSSSTVLVREAPKSQTSKTKAKIGDRAYVLLSIVEDNNYVRKSLREWLEGAFPKYQFIEAASGEQAIALP